MKIKLKFNLLSCLFNTEGKNHFHEEIRVAYYKTNLTAI